MDKLYCTADGEPEGPLEFIEGSRTCRDTITNMGNDSFPESSDSQAGTDDVGSF